MTSYIARNFLKCITNRIFDGLGAAGRAVFSQGRLVIQAAEIGAENRCILVVMQHKKYI